MGKPVQCLVLACLCVAAACVVSGQDARAADGEKVGEQDKKRAALWQALGKALPKEYREIDVYAENSSLSQILFRSRGTTLTFSLQTGKVEPVLHMKALPRINRITFEQNKSGGYFALWANGQRELTISAEK
jgi:hypothetical protein